MFIFTGYTLGWFDGSIAWLKKRCEKDKGKQDDDDDNGNQN